MRKVLRKSGYMKWIINLSQKNQLSHVGCSRVMECGKRIVFQVFTEKFLL